MLLLTLLIVPALFRLSAAREHFQCPLDDIERTHCMGPKDCRYPHPTRCDKFIQCDVNEDGRTARPTVKDCPKSTTRYLEWNDNEKICVWPKHSTCPKRHSVDTDINDAIKEASDILPRGDGVESKIRDAAPFKCPISDIVITQCRGAKDCLYPNPGSCNTFIQCSASAGFLSGTPAIKDCLPGREWNDKEKKCDVPEKSTCPVYANGEKKTRDDRSPNANGAGCTGPNCPTITPIDDLVNGLEGGLKKVGLKSPSGGKKIRAADSKDKFSCTGAGCPGTVIDGIANGVEDVLRKGAPSNSKPRDAARFRCPSKDIINTKCLGPKDCLYPNPGSCNTFIQCTVDPGERTGTPYVIPCPRGFEWNDNDKKCGSPEKSTCPASAYGGEKTHAGDSKDKFTCTGAGCPGTVIGEVTNGLEDILRNGRAPNRRAVNEDPLAFKCPAADIIRTKCRAHTDCVYARPSYCNEYIQCNVDVGGKTGTPVVVKCPRDFEWNDKIKECDDRSRSTCVQKSLNEALWDAANGIEEPVIQFLPGSQKRRAGIVSTRAAFTCPTADIIKTKCKGANDCKYPDPETCNHFYMCFVNPDGKTGTPYYYTCGEGLLWNDILKACNWPTSSTCKL
ncbi:hypothetical protein VF21_00840 [Pseudogymnoascus sp. 05NY08]|nr:hypothetical protein VF21_00840 [Pseudogymnoascus sp. 05NY08]